LDECRRVQRRRGRSFIEVRDDLTRLALVLRPLVSVLIVVHYAVLRSHDDGGPVTRGHDRRRSRVQGRCIVHYAVFRYHSDGI
jgi:hypothetical protein